MKNYQKGPLISFLIVLVVLIFGFVYAHSTNYNFSTGENSTDIKEASLKILSSWGPCPVADGCHETYTLNLNGEAFYNDTVKGNLPKDESQKFIKTALRIYQNNTCTPVYGTDVFENYELTVDGKLYTFGDSGGCKEMQNIFDSIKGSVSVQ